MSRHSLAATGLFVVLAAPFLIFGCSDSNPTDPLPPTKAVIVAPIGGAVLMADEPVQLDGYGVMSTGQPVIPNRLVWYMGAIPDTTFIATGFTPVTVIPNAGDYTITLIAYESVSFHGATSVNFTMEEPENWDPVATIIEPIDGEDFLPAHVVTVLHGSAFDVEDGDLDGDDVVWTSDLQGTLGTGALVEVGLLPGDHQIVLTATDSEGQADADTINVVSRHRPASPLVDGDFFFRARDFVLLCADKEITQVFGDCSIDVHEDTGLADMSIDQMAGTVSCETADVCFLQGELAQGNVRVTATGDLATGGTIELEFSIFLSAPDFAEGLLRAIEYPTSGPACVSRSYVEFALKTE